MKFTIQILAIAIAALLVVPSWTQADSGFYISGDLGVNFAEGVDTAGSSNDRASVCDEFINPNFATVMQTSGYENVNCTGPNRGATGGWENKFDNATGILAGAALGYSFSNRYSNSPVDGFRIEIEYFYRQSEYDETSDIPGASGESGDKLMQEIVQAIDRIDSITSHNLFGNLYYDFVNTSRFTPYIGVGGGIGFTDVEYGSVWARNDDPDRITTGEGLPNADMIRQNLAKTVSVAQTSLSDTLFGFQVLFGVDYAFTEAMSLGLKGRWVRFDSFRDDGIVWDPLRSHVPNIRRDGSEPVSGKFEIDDMEFLGVSLNMKYLF